MMLRFLRALVMRRLVQHEIGLFTVLPRLAVHAELQPGRVELGKRVVARCPVYRDFVMPHHDATGFARAETLGM